METGTGGTAVHMGINGHNVGVFCVHTVFAASNGGSADHQQVAVFLRHTGGVAAHGGSVQGDDGVCVVAHDTDRGSQVVAGDGRANIVQVAVVNHDGVVAKVDGVRCGLDGDLVARGQRHSNSVRRGAACGQTDRVSAHFWT